MLLILALASASTPASAQTGLPHWIAADPFATGEHDPLGIDRSDGLEATVPTRAADEVRERVPVQHGEVLSAIAGVRESAHDVIVRLAHGLAFVETTLRFTSSARYPAEARYRLAVPEGASLAALEVCNAHGCRPGLVDESTENLGPYDDAVRTHGPGGLPVAHAAMIRDERGPALWLRAAPVLREPRRSVASEPLTVRVRYVVSAPLRGARVRIAIPARGRDGRAAPAQILVRSETLSAGRVDELDAVEAPVERPADQPWEVSARLNDAPEVMLEGHRVDCEDGACVRLRAVAAPRPARARDVILLLDASPSTRGPTRGRSAPALATLLASLPSGARVRAAVFAARAEAVVERAVSPADLPLAPLIHALERELGSATRFEAAWTLIQPWVTGARDPLVVIVGDGGLTTGAASRRAFALARAAGAELASVNLADRPSTAGLRRALEEGLVIDAGDEAERANGGRMDALVERLSSLFAPIVAPEVLAHVDGRVHRLGALRAGEERVWEGVGRRASIRAGRTRRATDAPSAIALALRGRIEPGPGIRLAALAPESLGTASTCGAPPASTSAAAPPDQHLVLADARRCDRPAVPVLASSAPIAPDAPREGRIARIAAQGEESVLPSRSLLEMLRARIVPVARGCFREDRRGRPNYQTRAVFEFRLADREVVDAEVEGRLTPRLRACLLDAIDGLDIPRFDGAVQVRYPLYTAPQLPPPTLSLDADVADAVDALIER